MGARDGVRRPSSSCSSVWRPALLHLFLCCFLSLEAPTVRVEAFTLRAAAVAYPIRVAFQGEPGAYSEKALRELLGPHVLAIGKPSFEDTFQAVTSREVDYAVVPIENSLGGSIHANYDLLLRHELHIIGEHEFRVEHSLLALPGVKKEDIKRVMSHPQALAQCDSYLRNMGVARESMYDTAGSAKIIAEQGLRDCAAIASELAGTTYGLEVLDQNIEDDDSNFTRFLLLSRQSISSLIPYSVPAKTSIVFITPDAPGALYKALACFTLRDIDFCKIESRPTSPQLFRFLQFKQRQMKSLSGDTSGPVEGDHDLPRFRYCFYLDFLASQLDEPARNALLQLEEQSQYVRVLGSFPTKGQLLGPIRESLDLLAKESGEAESVLLQQSRAATAASMPPPKSPDRLKIGVIGFGKFGQFLTKTFTKYHDVSVVSRDDMTSVAADLGVQFFPLYDVTEFFRQDLDVIVLSVSILAFEEVLKSLPADALRGKLLVDVLSVKVHPKNVMLESLPADVDIICTHPMFGPESGKFGWQGLPFVYERVRIQDFARAERFLSIWELERCKMIEMSCDTHDKYAADSQFITHLTGRILGQQGLQPTPIDTRGFQSVLKLVDNTCRDSFDLFYGLFKYNKHSSDQIQRLREAFANVERQLAAKEAYLAARTEIMQDERKKLFAECRTLIREAVAQSTMSLPPPSGSTAAASAVAAQEAPPTPPPPAPTPKSSSSSKSGGSNSTSGSKGPASPRPPSPPSFVKPTPPPPKV